MKKLILIAAVLFGLNAVTQAQVSVTEENDVKNFRFGLKGDISLDWLSPDNEKKYESGGVGLGFDWGLQLEFKLNKNLSVMSGLSLKSSKGSLKYFGTSSADSVYYIINKDQEFVPFDTAQLSIATNEVYWLQKRSYAINYVNLPIALKMKTNEIGYLTYFGQFGANIGIKTKARVNDESKSLAGTAVNLEKLDLTDGIQPVRLGLLVGGGAEYNFSGTTSMFFAIHYNHYFTNTLVTEKREDYLRKLDYTDGQFKPVAAKALPGSVSLTVGILF